jgi:hypothetical protein
MTTHHYSFLLGQFSEEYLLEKCGEEEDPDKYFERLGFECAHSLYYGDTDGSDVKIYTRDDQFLCEIFLDGVCLTYVHIKDVPSLLIFIRDFGSTFTLLNLDTRIRQIEECLSTFFLENHGFEWFQTKKRLKP